MKQNNWFDPFFIFENLSEEDRHIQKNVKDFSESILKPNVVKHNRNEVCFWYFTSKSLHFHWETN